MTQISSSDRIRKPADHLAGEKLKTGWVVTQRTERKEGFTGGNFSVGYLVEKDGRQGFMKAVDMSRINETDDILEMNAAMRRIQETFDFEVKLLTDCQAKRLDRVVVAIDTGIHRLPGGIIGVPYIIFDRALGDVRTQMFEKMFDLACLFRCLHHTITGIRQLHCNGIVHNDIKASNILLYSGSSTKISDLGSAVIDSEGHYDNPHNRHLFAGDPSCAPPEVLYKVQFDAETRWTYRINCDLYQLGSLMVFLFTHAHMNVYLEKHLDPSLHPAHWGNTAHGTFDEALPYLMDAYEKSLQDIKSNIQRHLDPKEFNTILELIGHLCHPDPHLRGHPFERKGHRSEKSLERYVSILDRLATEAEIKVRRSLWSLGGV